MESAVQETTQPAIVSAAGVDFGRLKQWHAEYMAADGDKMDIKSSVITDVDLDHIDVSAIEDGIRQTMATTQVSGRHCDRCLHLFSNWPDLGSKSWKHAVGRPYQTKEIEAAARQGCASCSFLLTRLKAGGVLDTFRRIETRLSLLNDHATASVSVANWAFDGSGFLAQLLWLNLPGKTATHPNSPCTKSTEFESHVISPSGKQTLDSQFHHVDVERASYREDWTDAFEAVTNWLHTCSKQHENCYAKVDLERPTRLVSIGNNAVKLTLTAGWEAMPQYATLSYSWGDSDFLKLTPGTSESLFDAISLNDLPKTFRDAINITRKLGLEYIWIDALCIVQTTDNRGDWLRESGMMRSIYAGSYVNIAAVSATSAHDGCFSTLANYSGGFFARVESAGFSRVQTFHSATVYEDSTVDGHLGTRAWALQERLLAPRTLFIGDHGIFWECRSTMGSEFLPDGIPHKLGPRLGKPEHVAWNWSEIVRHYSRGNLTVASDKLTALAGVARRQHEVTGDDYLAGMWRQRLARQLDWTCGSKNRRPQWRAPTWSWASVDGPVHYQPYWDHDGLTENEYVEMIDASTSTTGPDPFGPVDNGELRLACSAILRGCYRGASGPEGTEPDQSIQDEVTIETDTCHFPISVDTDDFLGVGDSVYLMPVWHGKVGGYKRRKDDGDDAETDTEEETVDETDSRWVPVLRISGVILKQSGPKGRFRRMGSFCFESEGFHWMKPEFYPAFLRAIEEFGASTAQSECAQIRSDAEHSEARYIITII